MDADVLIVGAGPAGTAAAWRLRAAGLSVLMLDRTIPVEKPCAGGLTPKTLNLMPWSVAPVIERVVSGVTIGVRANGADTFTDLAHGDPICAFAVRGCFDAFNLRKAVEAGAEFMRATEVSSVEERPSGVTLTVDGRPLGARYLIGADGANSVVRRLIGETRWFRRGFALEGIVPYAEIAAEPRMELVFNAVKDGYGWLFPKGDHVNVGIYTHNADVGLGKPLLLDYAKRRLGTDRVGSIKGFPLGFGGARYVPDRLRIVLAGDAAGLAEPLLGEGLHNAVKSGQAAADAILDCEAGLAPLAVAYRRRLEPVQWDVARCDALALRIFYPRAVWLAPWLLRRPSVRAAFLKGFAAGRTMREITGRFLFPAPYAPATPTSLREFSGRGAAVPSSPG